MSSDRIISSLKGDYSPGTYVFPSSSSDGIGKVLSESNLRQFTNRIVSRNYKYDSSDFNLDTGVVSGTIVVSSGVAMINGYRVVIPGTKLISLTGSSIENNVKYDVYLKIAKQNSSDSYIVDVDTDTDGSDTGAIYFELIEHDDTEFETMRDYIDSDDGSLHIKKYKPAVYRFINSTYGTDKYIECEDISDDDYGSRTTNDATYTTSSWVINKYDNLFINGFDSLSLKDSVEYDISSDNNLSLRIGWVIMEENVISSIGTYNCIKRIDADDIFVGNTSLSDYLTTSDMFIRSYGNNLISSIRNDDEDILKIPYVATSDTINQSYDTGDHIYTNDKYCYIPYTYFGESCELNGNHELVNSAEDSKSIIECSYISANKEHADNENAHTEETISGSQILSIASFDECRTSYGYNIVYSVVNNHIDLEDNDNPIPEDECFVYKKCPSNIYYVGLQNCTSKAYDINVSNFDSSYTYFMNDVAIHNGVLYKCIVDSSLGDWDSTKENWEVFVPYPDFGLYCNNTTEAHIFMRAKADTTDGDDIDTNNYYETIDIFATSIKQYADDNKAFYTDETGSYYQVNHNNDEEEIISSVGFSSFNAPKLVEYTEGEDEGFEKFENVNISALKFYRSDTESDEDSSYAYLVDFADSNGKAVVNFTDNINAEGFIRAKRVYNAVYNDYAEWYNSNNARDIDAGDIIYYDPNTDSYTNTSDSPKTVVGVCSENYGFIVGGDDILDMESNRDKYVPVSLCGRVPVKINCNDVYECGDYLYADGTNVASKSGTNVIGKFIKLIDNNTALIQVYLA